MNGYIKELFDGKELKGEYKNGKKNGKGKEFDYNGIIKFEGEYLNGERNGKGKEYNNEGELIFEGNYSEGIRDGYAKLYNEGKLIFKGEYSDGKIKGSGDEYYDGKIIFKGLYYYRWNLFALLFFLCHQFLHFLDYFQFFCRFFICWIF